MSNGQSVTFTGSNADEIRDLDVHVVEHPTQNALVVFATDGDLDPVGIAAVGQVIEVSKDGVRVVGMPDPAAAAVVSPTPDQAPPALPPNPPLFDPSEHSVEEVQAYLLSLGADQAEADRVLAAEKAGKARKSLVDPGE